MILLDNEMLEQAGFTVIRFKNEEVLNEINRVRETILNTIEQLKPTL